MASPLPVAVRIAVEGSLDEAVAERLITDYGGQLGAVHGKQGRNYVRKHIGSYNNGARYGGIWFVLVDLDLKPDCAPKLVAEMLPNPAAGMCFRVAVHEVEAWLLADREGFAEWASVPVNRIPVDMEAIEQPKEQLVNIVRHSRRREWREAIVPREGSGGTEGPAYTSALSAFVASDWDVEAAASAAPSLARAIRCLRAKIAVA